jgi:hypothetical protein
MADMICHKVYELLMSILTKYIKPDFSGFYIYNPQKSGFYIDKPGVYLIINPIQFYLSTPAFPWGNIKTLPLLSDSYPNTTLLRTIEIRTNLN